MNTERDAVEVLAYLPHCTDAAVEKLAALAAPLDDAATISDLAAAYYVRAHRNDQPSDLVRALDAADTALRLAPNLGAARFNHALALEALGFTDGAITSWDSLRHDAGAGWTTDAQEHWAELTKQRTLSAMIQWPLHVKRLPEVARAGDRKAVELLVSPYRAAAQRYVEEDVLGKWAHATLNGRVAEAEEHLALAEMIASALERLTHDPYLVDSVGRIRASPQSPLLLKGHTAFHNARLAEQALDWKRAASIYSIAERALTAADSPMRLGAILGRVPALTFARKFDQSLDLLRRVERDGRRYPHLLARAHTGIGFLDIVQGRNADAIAEYGEAQSIFASINDQESVSNTHSRKIGLFRTVGQEDLTWREIFHALRTGSALSDAQSRHAFLGESASSAAALGCPGVALRYQNAAVQLLRNELSSDPTSNRERLLKMRRNLGIALRARASIRVQMRDLNAARFDLNEAIPLIAEKDDQREEAITSGLRARFAEVQAQTVEGKDRKQAIRLLTEAIDLAATTHYLTLTASLLTQRADLYRLEGKRESAVGDLRRAVEALRHEEQLMLTADVASKSEMIWSAYFSRYQEAYRQLIGLLVEDGADVEAFRYAEKARAYEPLHRVLQRDDVPQAFRQTIRGGEPLGLEEVKRALPSGTFVLQYTVLDDRTFVWLIWHDDFERRTLSVGNGAVAEWTTALQRLADSRDRGGWDHALSAPYTALLADPIARIAKVHRSAVPARIVIVPDRAMHGLPFAALRADRHLIQDYRVAVAASATLYTFSLEQDRQLSHRKAESVLIVADPAFDRKLDVARGLSPLTSARDEASQIERIYKPAVDVPPPLTGKEATVPAFLALAGRSTIIHIASHGVAIPAVPSQSYLLLAPAENDSGVLNTERLIAQLKLDRTRLVVLSACSTAGGTRIGPEGLAPLVRPLVAAGVPGVMGTLWKVDDNAATAELLVRFHQHYRDGIDADEALRLAQVAMLEDPDLGRSSPRVWAPFQMIGHASSPFAPPIAETRR
jgi:CHAT domain-containing protein